MTHALNLEEIHLVRVAAALAFVVDFEETGSIVAAFEAGLVFRVNAVYDIVCDVLASYEIH